MICSRGVTPSGSESDSEVVVHLYEELGPSCVEKLSGMFALAIWDAPRRRLVLARVIGAGKKPLYFRAGFPRGGLAFASEARALLAGFPEIEARPNLAAIDEYLTLQYVPRPHTAYEGIAKLEPAHVGVLEQSKAWSAARYWTKSAGPELTESGVDLAIELRRGCSSRRSGGGSWPTSRVGAFLSGGRGQLDRRRALMAAQSSQPVQTFSIGFPHASDSELPFFPHRRGALRDAAPRGGRATRHREAIVRASGGASPRGAVRGQLRRRDVLPLALWPAAT